MTHHPLSIVVPLGFAAIGCGPPPAVSTSPAAIAPAQGSLARGAEAPAAKEATETAPPTPIAAGPLEPYRVSASVSSETATNAEQVVVSWTTAGGPRPPGDVVPRARVTIDFIDPRPAPSAKAKTEAPATETFPKAGETCAEPALPGNVSFVMRPKRVAVVHVEVVGCRGGEALEATRSASARASVAWVSPYLDALEVPSVLVAGGKAEGRIRFRGLDAPGAPGAPPKVTLRASHPGVTVTKQPTVAASSAFELIIKPNVSGDVKLVAEHVDTDGRGRILGAIRKATTVRVRAASP